MAASHTLPQSFPIQQIPRSGVLTLYGYGIRVTMQAGHLQLEDGIGPERRNFRLPRVNHRLRRLVCVGDDGFDDARVAFMKSMDIIFCCNVLIYFDVVSKRRVIQHYYNNLLPHGYLFLGHSESLYGICDDFRLVHFPSATGYVKAERQITKR